MGNTACDLDRGDANPLRRDRPEGDNSIIAAAPVPRQGANGTPQGTNAKVASVQDRLSMVAQELFCAAMVGDAQKVHQALQAHADPDAAADHSGLRPLHLCAVLGHTGSMRVLLQHGADASAAENRLGLSPLSLACLNGRLEAAQMLVSASANVDGEESSGGTPLLNAALRNFTDLCLLLLRNGADANAVVQLCVPTGASEFDRRQWVLGRRSDNDPSVKGKDGADLDWRHILFEEPSAEVRVEGSSALHFAAVHGNARICEQLLEASARPSALDALRRSPLMLAGARGHVSIVTLLIGRGASVGVSGEGHTVGILAARAGHVPVLRLLLDLGVMEAHYVYKVGGVAMLHVAAHHGWGSCVAILCEFRADMEASLQPGDVRPLMLAAANGHADVCRELLDRSAAVDACDADGRSSWARAAAAGHAAVCQLLMNYGAVELVSLQGSPLEVAQATRGAATRRHRASRQAGEVRPPVHSTALHVRSGPSQASFFPML